MSHTGHLGCGHGSARLAFVATTGDLGAMAKGAALGAVKDSNEVGVCLGKVAKGNAIGLIHGSAEVGVELSKTLKETSLVAIQGGTEVALSLEGALVTTARALLRDVIQLRTEARVQEATAAPVEKRPEPPTPGKTATLAEIPVPVIKQKA